MIRRLQKAFRDVRVRNAATIEILGGRHAEIIDALFAAAEKTSCL
jgi:hypothetical protein